MPVRKLIFIISFFLLFTACQKKMYLNERKADAYAITTALPQDSSILRFLQPYKIGVDTQMQVVIGSTDIMLTKAQPESSLGNFIADAQLEGARKIDPGVDISIMNYGGIRLSYIVPGIITKGKLYELMPFDNMLTIVEIPGSVVHEFCDFMAQAKGWPVSGLKFVIKDKKATDILVNGKLLNEHLVYKMAISDYIAKGGDNCDFLSSLKKKFTSVFVRDAMIDYVMRLQSENKPLHPEVENRVTYAE